jgi:hypothetical protein
MFFAHSDMDSKIEVVEAEISELKAKLDSGTVPEAERVAIQNQIVELRKEIVELRKEKNILLQGGHVFRLLRVYVREFLVFSPGSICRRLHPIEPSSFPNTDMIPTLFISLRCLCAQLPPINPIYGFSRDPHWVPLSFPEPHCSN